MPTFSHFSYCIFWPLSIQEQNHLSSFRTMIIPKQSERTYCLARVSIGWSILSLRVYDSPVTGKKSQWSEVRGISLTVRVCFKRITHMCDSSLCTLAKLGALPDGSVNIHTSTVIVFHFRSSHSHYSCLFLNVLLTVCIKLKQLINEKRTKKYISWIYGKICSLLNTNQLWSLTSYWMSDSFSSSFPHF